jgi:hypothetical protein
LGDLPTFVVLVEADEAKLDHKRGRYQRAARLNERSVNITSSVTWVAHSCYSHSINGWFPLVRTEMWIRKVVEPTAMLLALTVQVAAQELPVLGQGNLSCSSWIDRRAGDALDAATMTAWVLGYITAFNQYAGPQGDISAGQNTKELTAWIDDYCRRNPADNFYNASAALIDKFRQKTSP